jgi:hypothetical protein
VNPDLSLFYHEWGARILDDPKASLAGDNPFDLGAALLLKEGQVRISGNDEKLAWIEFQLALDNLARHRMSRESNGQQEHDAHFQKGLLLDPQKKIHPFMRTSWLFSTCACLSEKVDEPFSDKVDAPNSTKSRCSPNSTIFFSSTRDKAFDLRPAHQPAFYAKGKYIEA